MRESVTAQCRRNSSPSCINHYGGRPGNCAPRTWWTPPRRTPSTQRPPEGGAAHTPHDSLARRRAPNSAGATHYGAARGVLTLGAGYCCRAHGRRGFKLWWGTDDPATRDGRMVGVLTHDAG